MSMHYFLLAAMLTLVACNSSTSQSTKAAQTQVSYYADEPDADFSAYQNPSTEQAGLDRALAGYGKAIFAGGCFWCTEEVFQRVKGVKGVYSGHIGGAEPNISYQQVGSGRTDYAEAVVIYFDPQVVTYAQLLEFFYASHNPTQVNGQGPDIGRQYRSAVFYLDEMQRAAAEQYQAALTASKKYSEPIATEINAAGTFYLAEAYHQNYYPNHPENPYVQRISRPKVEKFVKAYGAFLK